MFLIYIHSIHLLRLQNMQSCLDYWESWIVGLQNDWYQNMEWVMTSEAINKVKWCQMENKIRVCDRCWLKRYAAKSIRYTHTRVRWPIWADKNKLHMSQPQRWQEQKKKSIKNNNNKSNKYQKKKIINEK